MFSGSVGTRTTCALPRCNLRILDLWNQNEFEDERVDSKWKPRAASEKLHKYHGHRRRIIVTQLFSASVVWTRLRVRRYEWITKVSSLVHVELESL